MALNPESISKAIRARLDNGDCHEKIWELYFKLTGESPQSEKEREKEEKSKEKKIKKFKKKKEGGEAGKGGDGERGGKDTLFVEVLFLDIFFFEFTLRDLFFLVELKSNVFSSLACTNFHTLFVSPENGSLITSLSPSDPSSEEGGEGEEGWKKWGGDGGEGGVACSISTYPMLDKEHGIRAGEPICDYYEAEIYEKRHIFAIADGCNWGNAPREAAKNAATTAVRFLKEREKFPMGNNLLGIAFLALRAVMVSHMSIFEGLDQPDDAGGTTLITGIAVEIDKDSLSDPRDADKDWAVVIAGVGDCKAFICSDCGERAFDLTPENRSHGTAEDSGGRVGFFRNSLFPDLRNLHLSVRFCKKGDFFFACSDGVHDNLDPEHLGLTPDLFCSFLDDTIDTSNVGVLPPLLRPMCFPQARGLIMQDINYELRLVPGVVKVVVESISELFSDGEEFYFVLTFFDKISNRHSRRLRSQVSKKTTELGFEFDFDWKDKQGALQIQCYEKEKFGDELCGEMYISLKKLVEVTGDSPAPKEKDFPLFLVKKKKMRKEKEKMRHAGVLRIQVTYLRNTANETFQEEREDRDRDREKDSIEIEFERGGEGGERGEVGGGEGWGGGGMDSRDKGVGRGGKEEGHGLRSMGETLSGVCGDVMRTPFEKLGKKEKEKERERGGVMGKPGASLTALNHSDDRIARTLRNITWDSGVGRRLKSWVSGVLFYFLISKGSEALWVEIRKCIALQADVQGHIPPYVSLRLRAKAGIPPEIPVKSAQILDHFRKTCSIYPTPFELEQLVKDTELDERTLLGWIYYKLLSDNLKIPLSPPAHVDDLREVLDSVMNHCVRTTFSSREFMESKKRKKLPSDYLQYPGKMDHTTFIALVIGGSRPPLLSPPPSSPSAPSTHHSFSPNFSTSVGGGGLGGGEGGGVSPRAAASSSPSSPSSPSVRVPSPVGSTEEGGRGGGEGERESGGSSSSPTSSSPRTLSCSEISSFVSVFDSPPSSLVSTSSSPFHTPSSPSHSPSFVLPLVRGEKEKEKGRGKGREEGREKKEKGIGGKEGGGKEKGEGKEREKFPPLKRNAVFCPQDLQNLHFDTTPSSSPPQHPTPMSSSPKRSPSSLLALHPSPPTATLNTPPPGVTPPFFPTTASPPFSSSSPPFLRSRSSSSPPTSLLATPPSPNSPSRSPSRSLLSTPPSSPLAHSSHHPHSGSSPNISQPLLHKPAPSSPLSTPPSSPRHHSPPHSRPRSPRTLTRPAPSSSQPHSHSQSPSHSRPRSPSHSRSQSSSASSISTYSSPSSSPLPFQPSSFSSAPTATATTTPPPSPPYSLSLSLSPSFSPPSSPRNPGGTTAGGKEREKGEKEKEKGRGIEVEMGVGGLGVGVGVGVGGVGVGVGKKVVSPREGGKEKGGGGKGSKGVQRWGTAKRRKKKEKEEGGGIFGLGGGGGGGGEGKGGMGGVSSEIHDHLVIIPATPDNSEALPVHVGAAIYETSHSTTSFGPFGKLNNATAGDFLLFCSTFIDTTCECKLEIGEEDITLKLCFDRPQMNFPTSVQIVRGQLWANLKVDIHVFISKDCPGTTSIDWKNPVIRSYPSSGTHLVHFSQLKKKKK